MIEINNLYILRNWPLSIYLIGQFVLELNLIYDSIVIKLSTELYRIKEEKIKDAIENRCDNLKNNQWRTIDSITEKEMKKIYINRVIIENKQNEEILITEMDKIKEITVDHFKNFAGSKSQEIEIPDDWKEEYRPRTDFDSTIFKEVLMPVSDEEWKDMVQSVPLGKACELTSIAYEDLKQALEDFNFLLKEIINEVLDNQIIPEDWKKANIYLILKPKLWGYRLVNTRPITLLEIPRKAMMKIITK